MEITALGYIAALLTIIYLVFRKREMFLYTAVFFSGFSGASVLNIAGGSIQPSFFFFMIFFLLTLRSQFVVRLDRPLIIFFLYCVISIVFPFIFSHTGVKIIDQEHDLVPLSFSVSNVIHVLYLLFDLVFLNTLLRYKNDGKVAAGAFAAYRYGFYAVVLICYYQMLAFRFDLPFDQIFRMGAHGNIQGTRLYGPCDEASMLCYYLVPSILFCLQSKRSPLSLCFVFLGILIGVLSESSTFLVGMALLIVLAIPSCIRFFSTPHQIKVWRAIAIGLLCLFVVLILMGDRLSKLVELLIIKLKKQNDSGIDRSYTMLTSIGIGLRFPFGVGFGSARSADLFSSWFCNIGIVGMTIFWVYVICYIKKAYRKGCYSRTMPFLVTIILMFISVPEPYNLFIWFLVFYGTYYTERLSQKRLSSQILTKRQCLTE